MEGTNQAEIRPEEQSEKVERCWENSWNEVQLKRATKTETDSRTAKKDWASSVGLHLRHKPWHPHHRKVNLRGPKEQGGGTKALRAVVDSLGWGGVETERPQSQTGRPHSD